MHKLAIGILFFMNMMSCIMKFCLGNWETVTEIFENCKYVNTCQVAFVLEGTIWLV